jgi:hypothetical protein
MGNSIFRSDAEMQELKAARTTAVLFQGIPIRMMDHLLEPRDDWHDDQWWNDYHQAMREL